MQVQDSFESAANRHLTDALGLFERDRWDNAGYLAGYAGECAVKAVIAYGGPFAARVLGHIHEFAPAQLLLAADLSLATRRYPIDLDADLEGLHREWTTALRYAKTHTLGQTQAKDFVTRAERVCARTVGRMVLDGVFSRVPE